MNKLDIDNLTKVSESLGKVIGVLYPYLGGTDKIEIDNFLKKQLQYMQDCIGMNEIELNKKAKQIAVENFDTMLPIIQKYVYILLDKTL